MKLVSNIAHTQLSLHSMRKPEEVGYYSPIDRFSGCKSIPAKEHDRRKVWSKGGRTMGASFHP